MCCTEPIGFDVPDEVSSMLLSYQDMREGDPDGLWGDRAALWVRTLVYRCPFLGEPRRREPWRQVRQHPDWTDSQEFPAWVRDVVREDGKPDELTVVHLNDAGVEVDPAVLPWVLPDGEPTRRHVLVDSHLAEPVVVDARTTSSRGCVPSSAANSSRTPRSAWSTA
ncbi:hypothetical protein [Actinopolymorpha pittospori]|uniref:Uncharacterized protein n=1 Tax=Actinopolymorpha pittospori TaxID=648752 RepID=A0A927N560_9ACTN|nr:hypothetical protein [Actinopolymorpha pittospori]MBE1612861.1 hypothetical protein [Actinopolymorpha pittospori]